jgi:hypothetical protein
MKNIIILIVLKLILLSNINAQFYSVYDEGHEFLDGIIKFMILFEIRYNYDNFNNNLSEVSQSSIAHKLKVPICEYENYSIYQEMHSTSLNTYFSDYFLLYKNNILEKIIYPIRWSYNRYIYLSQYNFDVVFEDNYFVILQPKGEDPYIASIKIYKYYFIDNSFDENSNSAVLVVNRK